MILNPLGISVPCGLQGAVFVLYTKKQSVAVTVKVSLLCFSFRFRSLELTQPSIAVFPTVMYEKYAMPFYKGLNFTLKCKLLLFEQPRGNWNFGSSCHSPYHFIFLAEKLHPKTLSRNICEF